MARLAAGLLLLAVSAPCPASAGPSGQLRAYASLVLADEARDEGDWAEAHAGYGKALELYQGIKESDPEWQPDIVAYRIRYCRKQLEALAPYLVPEAATTNAPGGHTMVDSNELAGVYQEKVHALTGENVYLRNRVAALEEELEQALTEDPEIEAATHALRQELAAARAETAHARVELAAYREEARTAARDLQTALAAARLEHAETMAANQDLVRQLEAAAAEHMRLTEALRASGKEVRVERPEVPTPEEEAGAEDTGVAEPVESPTNAPPAGNLSEIVPY
jgi:hypothetical protein